MKSKEVGKKKTEIQTDPQRFARSKAVTSALLRVGEQGQRLKINSMWRGGQIRQKELPPGSCSEQHGVILQVLSGVKTTEESEVN